MISPTYGNENTRNNHEPWPCERAAGAWTAVPPFCAALVGGSAATLRAGVAARIEVNSVVTELPSPSPASAEPMPRLNIAMAARSIIFTLSPLRLPLRFVRTVLLPVSAAPAITTCGAEQD